MFRHSSVPSYPAVDLNNSYLWQARVEQAQMDLNQARLALNDAKDRIDTLNNTRASNRNETQEIIKEKVALGLDIGELSQTQSNFSNQLINAKLTVTEFVLQLDVIDGQRRELQGVIDGKNATIQELRERLKDLPPQPVYHLDGEYCKNGYRNCPNHPPRQVLTNQAEIDEYNRCMQELKRQLECTVKEENNLETELDVLNTKYNSLYTQYQSAEDQANAIDSRIQETNSLISDKNQQIQLLENRLAALSAEFSQTDNEITQAQCDLAWYEQNVQDKWNDLNSLQQSSQFSQSTPTIYSEAELEAIALREMGISAEQPPPYQGSTLREEDLLRIALQELAQEGQFVGQTVSSLTNSIKESVGGFREGVQRTASTITDLWQGGVGTATGLVMKEAEEVVGSEPKPTGNFIVDGKF